MPDQPNQQTPSADQPIAGSAREQEQRTRVEPSGYNGRNPATAGPGATDVQTSTPENREGQLSSAAPANTGVTPGSTAPGE